MMIAFDKARFTKNYEIVKLLIENKINIQGVSEVHYCSYYIYIYI